MGHPLKVRRLSHITAGLLALSCEILQQELQLLPSISFGVTLTAGHATVLVFYNQQIFVQQSSILSQCNIWKMGGMRS